MNNLFYLLILLRLNRIEYINLLDQCSGEKFHYENVDADFILAKLNRYPVALVTQADVKFLKPRTG